MEAEGAEVLVQSGIERSQIRFARSADLRYVGQFNEVEVDCPSGTLDRAGLDELAQAFHRGHEQTFAFSMKARPIEIIYLRVRAIAAARPILLKEVARGDAARAPNARKPDRRCFFKGIGWRTSPVYDGHALICGNEIGGPALIEESGIDHPGAGRRARRRRFPRQLSDPRVTRRRRWTCR